ncbi:ABC transporter permease [Kurthia populi]|uniref:ABC transporter permease n=1 Tax=Kurthia populi TaxID=1562132 RepID=A0ABW5Y3Q0_9BACL
MRKMLPPLIVMLVLLAVWEWLAHLIASPYILPSPRQIIEKIWLLREPLFMIHLPATLAIIAIGLVISLVLGIALALVMDASAWLERAFYPLLVVSQTIPTTALAPIFVLWFGYSIWSKVLVTVLIAFFPIAMNTFDGLRSVKKGQLELLQTFGASRWQQFWKLKVPSAIPSFFTGLKIAVPLTVIGAAIGEWLGAQSGLGYFSKRMMTQMDGAGVFAPIVVLSLLAIVFATIMTIIEKKYITWRKEA